jgi:putative zinc finger/helix-turn-helix YgiT family protein
MGMTRCTECESDQLVQGTAPDTLTVGGQTFTADLPVVRCEACGAVFFDGPAVGEFERAVARELAQRGPATGETFRFMRKALGMRAADLAEMLDVTPETLSRWETGKLPMGRTSWLTLSSLVLDYEATCARLQAAKAGPGLAKAVVRLDMSRRMSR